MMKRTYFLLCVFLLSSFALAQQKRFLVGTNGDVVRLKRGESASRALQQLQKEKGLREISEASCTNPLQFGYNPIYYPPGSVVWISYAKDMFGEWFTVPTDGVIDTFYTYHPGGSQGMNADSSLTLRMMASRIYNGSGPGFGPFAAYLPGPADPTLGNNPRCWGYFTNTNDLEGQAYNISPPVGGVAAFPGDATPPDTTAWVSTLQRQFPDAPVTFPPTGYEVWGLGGYPFRHLKAGAVNKYNLHIIGAPTVSAGQSIFVAFVVPGQHWDDVNDASHDPAGTEVYKWDAPTDANGFYHTHTWKFYEHNGTCGIPGWTDRGFWEVNMWYSMTVTGNTPPRVLSITDLGTTVGGGSPRDVTINIEDCNFAHAESAGVAWAHMAYSVDGGEYTMIPLDYFGGTTWHGQIPAVASLTGRPYSRTVQYYVAAADSQGLVMDSGIVHSYKVLSWGDEWYRPDTSVSCTPVSIADAPGSHYLDTTSTLGSSPHPTWFPPPYSGSAKAPKDDGTAGPFSLGGPFVYFGDTVNYAWIGLNGAIALSRTATDTIDVNSNGYYTDYDFPSTEHYGRGDTTGAGNMPRNFIGALWYDLYYVDTGGVQSGRVFWKSDSCRFIAEYDSIGEEYDGAELPPDGNIFIPYGATFRIILNRCEGTFDFQWDNVQEAWKLDTISSVAFQGNDGRIIRPDSVVTEVGNYPGWYKFYRGSDNGPMNLKPRDGFCVRFHPFVGTAVASGWNMISVPTVVPDSNYSKTYLYSAANSQAFGYKGGYVQSATLLPGVGYWLKFPATSGYETPGDPRLTFLDSVKTDWNMVGAIGRPVYVSNVVQSPSGIVSSQYYGYRKGYYIATTLDPGRGYWVKSRALGTLQLTTTPIPKLSPVATDLTVLNRITISDANGYQQALYLGSESPRGRV
ncbi:MAG: hypothetical protein ABSF91_15730 [Bacteroidota bacterium]